MRARQKGTWVGLKVQLVRQLAVGTTSTVWLGRHRDRREPVAVKLLDGRLHRTMGSEIVRFHREAKALEQLRSAHSVRLLEHGLTGDEQPFLVMELLRGQTLEARLRRDGTLSVAEVTRMVQQLTAALGEAHELGIVHRDVTPDNVFLVCAEQLVAKLLDFGLAKHMKSGRYAISTSDAVQQSAMAVAPEMLRVGGEVDHRVDLWALGALAYRALTGAHPFAAADYHETIRRMKAGEVPTLAELGLEAELPSMLDHFFSVALAPNPGDRYASTEELAAAWMWAVGEEDSVDAVPPHVSAVRLAPTHGGAERSSPRAKRASRDDLTATLVVVEDEDPPIDLAETRVVVDDEDDFAATRVRESEDDSDLVSTRVSASDDDDDDDGGGTLIVTDAATADDDDDGGGTLIVTDTPVSTDLVEDDDEPLTVVMRDEAPPSSTRILADVIDEAISGTAPRPELPLGAAPAPSPVRAIEVVDRGRDHRAATLVIAVTLLALVLVTVLGIVLATP